MGCRIAIFGCFCLLSLGLVSAQAQTIRLVEWADPTVSGSWEDATNWSPAIVPDDYPDQVATWVRLPTPTTNLRVDLHDFHTVRYVVANPPEGLQRSPDLHLFNDLRALEAFGGIDVTLHDGKDLIFGGVNFDGQPPNTGVVRVWGLDLNIEVNDTFPERTPRITADAPLSLSQSVIDGGYPLDGVPWLTMDGEIAYLYDVEFRGAMRIENTSMEAFGPVRFLTDRRYRRDGGVVDALLAMRPDADGLPTELIWSDAWTLGPNGSIDVGGNKVRLESSGEYGYFGGNTFQNQPALSIDLSRLTFDPVASEVVVADSLTIDQWRDLRNRAGVVSVGQQAQGFEPPTDGTDLLGQTISLGELSASPGDVGPSGFVLVNGTVTAPVPGQVVRDLSQVNYLLDVTVQGGLDVSDWITTDGPKPFMQRLGDVTIADGMLTAVGHTPIDASDRVLMRFGNAYDISTPTEYPGSGVGFTNSGLAENIELDVYGRVTVEGPFQLDGEIVLGYITDHGGAIYFQNGVELTGNGAIVGPTDYRPGGEFSEHAIRVEGGNLTIGAGVTIDSNGGFSNGYVFDANDNDVIIDGELSMYGGEYSPSILRAGELWIRDGSFGASAFEVETLRMGRDGSLGVTVQTYALASVRSTAQNAVLDGELRWGFGYPRPESANVITLLESDSITGRFASIAFTSHQNPASSDHRYAVIYEATAVKARLALFGDANLNGAIEQGDLDAVLNHWGSNNASIADANDYVSWVTGDFTGDGVVDQADLDAVLNGWGSSSVPDFRGVVVPEPGVALVGLLGTLGVVARRRRG